MKRKVIILIALLMVLVATTACGKTTKADTPLNAGSLTKIGIERQDYDGFINSLMKDIKDPISEEYFNEIKTIVTPGAEHKTYQLLKFENNEMLLIQLSPEKIDGEYKIQEVMIVPNEMKTLFR